MRLRSPLKRGAVRGVLLLCAGALSGAVPEGGLSVRELVFVAFDTETTGFSPGNDRLVEIGAVRFRGDGEVLAVTNWLIHPGMEIPFQAERVHGIGNDSVANAPDFQEVFPQFETFCDGGLLLAHNATFDVGFLRAGLHRAGMQPPPLQVADTLKLFRRWFPQAASHSLEPLSLQLGVQGETYHRAVADSFHILRIFTEGLKSRPDLTLKQLRLDAGGFRRLDERIP